MSEENETTGYTKALRMFPVVNEKSVPVPLIWEDLAAAARAVIKTANIKNHGREFVLNGIDDLVSDACHDDWMLEGPKRFERDEMVRLWLNAMVALKLVLSAMDKENVKEAE